MRVKAVSSEISTIDPEKKGVRAKEKVVSPLAAATVIIITVAALLTAGAFVGYKFFWNIYDKDSKVAHDFKAATARVNANPNDPGSRLALGWSYAQQGELDKAMEQYQDALELEPDNIVARYNIALVKIAQKDLQGARADLEGLRKDTPEYLAARATLGKVYRELGDCQLSAQELELVASTDGGNADILFELGKTYEKMGDKAKAKSAYQKALSFAPGDTGIQAALAALN